jgi:hypothetical protein
MLIIQKRHGYGKKCGHMKVEMKKKKKSWTHEGPRKKERKKRKKRRKIAMSTKESK